VSGQVPHLGPPRSCASRLSVGECAQAACLFELTARKPGNVHRFCDFEDVSYLDFALSAAAIGGCLEEVHVRGVGGTILQIISRTRQLTATNTNLGIALLLTPLASVPREQSVKSGIEAVLRQLSVADAKAAYEAIRLARPSGLGEVPDQDVKREPTKNLREAMALAADRDFVARQYANGYREVFAIGLPALLQGDQNGWSLEESIIQSQLALMAACPDSLIARKRGRSEAEAAAKLAAEALREAAAPPLQRAAVSRLDAWLRAEGHQRNPGTTADLVTTCLFAALRDGLIRLPLERPFARSGER
jgi:triphosphoribosyl-dephospho-CoA synthase